MRRRRRWAVMTSLASYFPAQNWRALTFAQNWLGSGKLQDRTGLGLTLAAGTDLFL